MSSSPVLNYARPSRSMWRACVRAGPYLLGVLVIGGIVTLATLFAWERYKEYAHRRERARLLVHNQPAELIANFGGITFPDPGRVRLPDGRVYRLFGVAAPDRRFRDAVWEQHQVAELEKFVHDSGTLQCGINVLGANPRGELVAELWVQQPRVTSGLCGNSGRDSIRRASMVVWKNVTHDLGERGRLGYDDQHPLGIPTLTIGAAAAPSHAQ